MIGAILSYIAGLKASALVGKAVRLKNEGKRSQALNVARSGLNILRKPYVNRLAAAEGAALTSLTILVEQLASETMTSGAETADLRDALAFLQSLDGDECASVKEALAWVPHLKARLEGVS
jgi:hypothetical protein